MGRKRKVQKIKEVLYPRTDHNSNAAMGAMNIENTISSYSNGLPPKKIESKVGNSVIRRSVRLKNLSVSNRSQKAEPAIKHVNLVESEEKETNHQQGNTLPVLNQRKLEEKVDYIIQVVDELNSKTSEKVMRREIETLSNDHSYKSLYIDSQKKIEALMEKHYELVRKMEFALGKIDVYERMNRAMGASKEVILVSRLEKDTEALSLSRPTIQRCISAAADENASPKQKKNYKKKAARS